MFLTNQHFSNNEFHQKHIFEMKWVQCHVWINELQIIFYLNVCHILMILMPKRLTVKGFE